MHLKRKTTRGLLHEVFKIVAALVRMAVSWPIARTNPFRAWFSLAGGAAPVKPLSLVQRTMVAEEASREHAGSPSVHDWLVTYGEIG